MRESGTRWLGEQERRSAAAVHEVARDLARADDVAQVLGRVAQLALRAAGGRTCYLERIDRPRRGVVVVATAGEAAPLVGSRIPYPGSLVEEVIERDRPQIAQPGELRAREIGGLLSDSCHACIALVLPLTSDRAPLGALILLRGADQPFDDQEIASLRVFADLAALSLRHVTDRERAGEQRSALRESERRFQLLVQSVKDYAIFMLDPSGRVVSWNEGAERIKGYTAEEAVGRHVSAFYTSEDRERDHAQEALDQARRHDRFEEEGWRVRRDGTPFWARVTITAVRDEYGELLGFAKVTRDLTEQRRVEIEADLERRRLRTVLDALPVGVFISDRDGRILEANGAAREIWGGQAPRVSGPEEYGVYRAWLPTTGKPLVASEWPLARAVRNGEIVQGETLEIEGFDGGRKTLLAYALPVRDDAGEAFGGVAVVVDVSDRERLLHEARQARVAAERANRSKSDFLATMSHEIRTPINAIIGYTELLEMGISGPTTEAQRTQLTRVRSSSNHLLGLVNDVLDLAKVEAGRMTVHRGTALAAHTISSALALVGPQAAARGVEIREACPPGRDLVYCGDEDRVRQVLVNIVSNAVKFTAASGSVTLSCGRAERAPEDARLDGPGPWIFISVADTGLGIPSEEREKVFEAFTQVDTGHTRKVGGSGLGLTISRELARLMGGEITLESRLGEGSTFTLWLPVPRPQEPAEIREGETPPKREVMVCVGRAVLDEVQDIMVRFAERLREAGIPGGEDLSDADLQDHGVAFLSDIAQSLVAWEEAEVEPLALLRDGGEIQRVISELHGAQRRRLGWGEEEIRTEFAILREEVEQSVRRQVVRFHATELDDALSALMACLDSAERISCRAVRSHD